jgi:phosphate transporter
MPEESPIRHRYSISSSDENADLEDSLASPKSPIGTIGKARALANKLNFMKESFASSIHDTIWTAKTNYAYDMRLLYKRKITALFISVSSLRSYVEINYSGFRKILKK